VRLATFLLAAAGRATVTQMLAGGLAAAGARARDTRACREAIMTEMLRNLREQLPNTEDVLHQIGLQYERNAGRVEPARC
jgi:hypothetical protein